LKKAIGRNGEPSLINIDKSGANKAAISQYNDEGNTIEIRQCKYLNNMIEQDHRFIKRITRAMLGFKNFHAVQRVLKGIELMRMLKKGQMKWQSQRGKTSAELFYALAG
jgi:putative transposase